MVESITDLRLNGSGSGAPDLLSGTVDPATAPSASELDLSANPDGMLTSSMTYDDNGNVLVIASDAGRQVSHQYDDQDRLIRKTFGDGSYVAISYGKDGSVKSHAVRAAGGSLFREVVSTYDADGRLVREDVGVPAPSAIEGSRVRTYEYDGLDRQTRMTDDNGGAPYLASTVTRTFDSLGRVRSETQNGRTVTRDVDAVGARVGLTYPNGRHVAYEWDDLGRISAVREGAGGPVVASYQYYGEDRPAVLTLGNGVTIDHGSPSPTGLGTLSGYGPSGRPERVIHRSPSGATLSDVRTDFNRNGRRVGEARVNGVTGVTRSDAMEYDSNNRLAGFEREKDGAGQAELTQSYAYDGDSGWLSLVAQAAGQGPSAYPVTPNATGGYAAIIGSPVEHDLAGNRTVDFWFVYRYDAFDRLVRVAQNLGGGAEGLTIVRYSYDASGRRIEKRSYEGTQFEVATRYHHEGDRVIEERDVSGQTTAQYVYGNGIDEVLQMRRDFGAGMVDGYFLHDARGSVVGITDSAGALVERYAYDAYGAPRFLHADGTPILDAGGKPELQSVVQNPYLFQGREYDHETAWWKRILNSVQGYFAELDGPTGQYYFRARYHDPQEGRFASRDSLAVGNNDALDPAWLVDRILAEGTVESPYVFENADPVNQRDPDGRTTSATKARVPAELRGKDLGNARGWMCADELTSAKPIRTPKAFKGRGRTGGWLCVKDVLPKPTPPAPKPGGKPAKPTSRGGRLLKGVGKGILIDAGLEGANSVYQRGGDPFNHEVRCRGLITDFGTTVTTDIISFFSPSTTCESAKKMARDQQCEPGPLRGGPVTPRWPAPLDPPEPPLTSKSALGAPYVICTPPPKPPITTLRMAHWTPESCRISGFRTRRCTPQEYRDRNILPTDDREGQENATGGTGEDPEETVMVDRNHPDLRVAGLDASFVGDGARLTWIAADAAARYELRRSEPGAADEVLVASGPVRAGEMMTVDDRHPRAASIYTLVLADEFGGSRAIGPIVPRGRSSVARSEPARGERGARAAAITALLAVLGGGLAAAFIARRRLAPPPVASRSAEVESRELPARARRGAAAAVVARAGWLDRRTLESPDFGTADGWPRNVRGLAVPTDVIHPAVAFVRGSHGSQRLVRPSVMEASRGSNGRVRQYACN